MTPNLANTSLADLLDRHTTSGAEELSHKEGDRVRCLACNHRCLLAEGRRGICKVRFCRDGQLRVPFGYVAGLHCDLVEKKPFFHVLPGCGAMTFGMLGCDLHCSFCQNWLTSQALRDPNAGGTIQAIAPGEVVQAALRQRAQLVVSSYNEPLITAEWAVGIFREATAAGLGCAFVSNGNATPEVLDFLRPWMVALKVDLKCFNDRRYRSLGGTLNSVTRTIRLAHERGLWVEVVTLLVPGFNDAPDELRQTAAFLASVSPDLPWHLTAFHKDYRLTDPEPTTPEELIQAAEIGVREGLHFVYTGNRPGRVGSWEDTRCTSCNTLLVERQGFLVRSQRITSAGLCPTCRIPVPGLWSLPGKEGKVADRPTTIPTGASSPGPPKPGTPAPGPTPSVLSENPTGKGKFLKEEKPTQDQGVKPPVEPSHKSPNLSGPQKRQLLLGVAAMLRTSVAGKPAVFPKELAELGNRPVAGAFVSLKRSRHLRSCCGLFGATLPLGQALEQATVRAAWEDPRFPPLSPTELDRLNMEVWLLYAPELVKHRGEQRLQAITLGTHGIQVVRDQARGLFLPSVPVEAGWDVLQYLEQVCLKAGLPPHSWKEDETALYRFEGVSLRTPLADIPGTVPVANRAWPCRPEDLLVYQEWCRSNLMALALGATPSYYCPQVSDGSLTGLILQLPSAGRGGRTFGQFSLRPPLPLQATLFSLVQSAAQYLAGQGGKTGSPSAQPLRLTFLQDPVLQGSVADPHLEGLNPKQRGLLVLENDRLALVFDPGRSPEELLAEATNQVRVRRPAAASLFSLEVLGAGPVSFSTVPRPDPGAGIRPPAVAGRFYSADAADLTRTVESLLNGERRPEPWPAALVPHAGLAFSGRVAGEVFRRLLLPPQIIVIGPKHTRPGLDWAVAPHQSWGLPGRTLEADPQLARQLCQAIPGLEMDAAAHQHEHSIEVQLPFLAHLAPKIRVVGIVVGPSDLDHCCRFAQGLAGLLRNLPQPPLLLISSDLNHFAPDPENRRLDALALKALQKGDPKELFQTVTQHHISMCGLLPAVIVLETLRLLGRLQRIEQVAYATSGEATGDLQRVVGYGGMLFGPGMGN